MALIKKYWKFTQEEAMDSWEINNIPEGAIDPVITHIKLSNGAILQPESQALAPFGIELSFGVTPLAGIAYGEYFAEDSSVVIDDGNGNIVNITINQGGSPATGETF